MGNTFRSYVLKPQLPVIFLLLLFLWAIQIQGQENNESAIGSWMVFSMENQLSERWSIPVVAILSYENWTEQTEFGFARIGISYKAKSNLVLTLGTAYVDSQPFYHNEFETLTTQFWLYEEASINTGKQFKHRLRLENRWIDTPMEKLFNVRFRYRFEFKQSLTKTLFLKCTNEPFFNFDELHIDQNRFFLGVGSKINKDLSTEVGYFKTHIGKDNYDRIRVVLHIKTSIFQKNLEDISSKEINKLSKKR